MARFPLVDPAAQPAQRDVPLAITAAAAAASEDTNMASLLPRRAPTVLVLNGSLDFIAQCKLAVRTLFATIVDGSIGQAGELVAKHQPCAIVVTDDIYAFDRAGLNRLALDHDAHLVVWSDDLDGSELEPLLLGAIRRWDRSSYEQGAILDGRYELLRDLGDDANGSGRRWEVRNVRTSRRSLLALAQAPPPPHDASPGVPHPITHDASGEVEPEGSKNEEARRNETEKSLRRELRALARLTHPGAVELRDAGTTELGDFYLVLEPLEGRTLGGLVAARTKLEPEAVGAVVLQVSHVLAAAHAAGVEHGHVAAEHVVIVRDGYGIERVKLTGWGRSVVRSPASVRAEHDLAALAGCAFEALTGHPFCVGTGEEPPSAALHGVFPGLLSALFAGEIRSATELVERVTSAFPAAQTPTRLLDAQPKFRDPAKSLTGEVGVNSRRFPRAAYRTPVHIEVAGIGSLDGRSEDISSGGLLVIAKGGLKAETEVTVRFALPLDGRVISEPAVIKWSKMRERADERAGQSALGLEFVSASQETLRQVERYVALMGE